METKTNRGIPEPSVTGREWLQKEHACCIYSRMAVLKASGEKVLEYLQGQVTQDVHMLSDRQAIYACALTPQGKPVADMHVLMGHHDELLIITEASHAVELVGHLRRFSLGYDIRLGIVESMAAISVQGPGTDAALEATGLPVPDGTLLATASLADKEVFALRLPEAADHGIWLACPAAKLAAYLQALGHGISEADMEAARILHGTPRFGVDWDEGVHPLNANLIERHGVSFDKGCYIGQEVTSRMHWRKAIKWRLYRVKAVTLPPTLPCDVRTHAAVGRISSMACTGPREYAGIASLRIKAVEAALPMQIGSGVNLEVLEPCHGA